MKAEVISIGTELTTGQNLDTNCQWLSTKLAAMGIPVHFHTTIADDVDDMTGAFRVAARRATLVLVTGGLGPTLDDLTRDALAMLIGRPLVFHEESFCQIEAMFARRQRVMPERNRVQAMFPEGAEPIANRHGTAPGIWMDHAGSTFVAMPGVPSEMFAMFEESVRPRLISLGLGKGVLLQRKINCFGAGESAIEALLPDITRRGHVPEVGITASDATISLRIIAKGANTDEVRASIDPIERTIVERLGELVYGVEHEELEDSVSRLLDAKRQTVATAESITAGQVARRLARVPGISQWFVGGIVAYCNRLKHELLGVPLEILDEHGAVSAPVAEAMAEGCRRRLGCDLAISTTGLAGPDGDGSDKSVGQVFVGLAWQDGVASWSHNWGGTRVEVQSRTAKLALNRLRLHLLRH